MRSASIINGKHEVWLSNQVLMCYQSKVREIEEKMNIEFTGDWDCLVDVKEFVEAYGDMAGVESMSEEDYLFFVYGIEL